MSGFPRVLYLAGRGPGHCLALRLLHLALVCAAVCGGLCRGAGAAQSSAPARAVAMSFDDCLKTALVGNPDIEIQTIDVIIAQKDVDAEAAAFDPDFSANFSFGDSRRPTASVVTGNRRKTTELSFGYGRQAMNGDAYEMTLSQVKQDTNSRYSSLNPSYTLDLAVNYTHPLAQGRGRQATVSRLKATSLNKALSELALQNEVMDIAYRVEDAYWTLVYASEALVVRKDSLTLAHKTLERTRAMVQAGALAESQVLLVQAQLAQREEDVIAAEGQLDRAILDLKLVMNVDVESALWGVGIVPADPGAQAPQFEALPFEQGLALALGSRPDYLGALQGLEIRRIETTQARDRAKPALDLVASVGLGGLQDDYGGSIQDITSLQYPSWEMGLWLDLPLGRKRARARVQQSLGNETIAALEIGKSKRRIAVEIASAEVGLNTARNRVQAAAVSRGYAEEKLAEEVEKHTLGIATTHDVLEYQEDLAVARLNETNAIIDLNRAVLDYHYTLGMLLDVNRIQVRTTHLDMGRMGQEARE